MERVNPQQSDRVQSDEEADASHGDRGDQQQGTVKDAFSEEADKTASRGSENEKKSQAEKPGCEDAYDEEPNTAIK
jgi:hypothetical protein